MLINKSCMIKNYIYTLVVLLVLSLISACKKDNAVQQPDSAQVNKVVENSKKEVAKAEDTRVELDYDNTIWDEITFKDGIYLELRYATKNNFVGEVLYSCGRCFLRPEVYNALMKVNNELESNGYRLKMFDCYRPKPIQERLWEIMPNDNYVTNPMKGSMHNRGLAVDLTIVDENGDELNMGTEFDFFGEKAHSDYTDLPVTILANRNLLKTTMEKHGFKGIRTEWWHFSMPQAKYPISDWEWKCY